MKIKKIITLSLSIAFLISLEAKAADECFEKTRRAIFKFNMAFDRAVVEPIARGLINYLILSEMEQAILPQISQLCFQYPTMYFKETLLRQVMRLQVF